MFAAEARARLGPRLDAIASLVGTFGGDIWDLGCDHGHLAAHLKQADMTRRVHAVDRGVRICANLEVRCPELEVRCCDVAQLELESVSEPQLIVIAGLGGDTVAHWVEHLLASHRDLRLEFVLCPVRQCLRLRRRLSALPLAVTHDELVAEKGRIYEVLALSTSRVVTDAERPWPVGPMRWATDDLRLSYRNERLHAHRFDASAERAYRQLFEDQEERRTCVG